MAAVVVLIADHHQVIKVKMSKPIVHDVTSCEPINWKVIVSLSFLFSPFLEVSSYLHL